MHQTHRRTIQSPPGNPPSHQSHTLDPKLHPAKPSPTHPYAYTDTLVTKSACDEPTLPLSSKIPQHTRPPVRACTHALSLVTEPASPFP
ncbi:hypothetical protein M011DRAFT_469711 [Sporormia fimetaria CBS 119925]|uniref:Uncharacterized protein n=1 Tax=Sporormia fimetaria CBS 119925 TaxID=1340428 RepID=A0A6A6V752_9PLEO|nr:hypothetical protein M011DRAFT_469711 [Sporormia fimetaria CBS 119925]